MVQQNRRVVENYVLYKLEVSNFIKSSIPNSSESSNQQKTSLGSLTLPQKPSLIDVAVRNLATQYEKKYKETFPDLLDELRNANVSAVDVHHIFSKITKDLFQLPLKQIKTSNSKNGNVVPVDEDNNNKVLKDIVYDDSHIKWGHVIALLVFAGILAVRAVECDSVKTVDDIVAWVTNFFDTELSYWLGRHGGWEDLVKWSGSRYGSSRDEFDPSSFTSGLRSLMSVGVIAACVGLGAFMMAKKLP